MNHSQTGRLLASMTILTESEWSGSNGSPARVTASAPREGAGVSGGHR